MNIVEPIFAQCRNKPTELALCAPGTDLNLVSYGRLERCVNNICRRAISAGVAPGNRIAVFIDDQIFHAMVLIALTRLGIVTISGRQRNFSWRFTVDAVIADRSDGFSSGRIIVADSDWMEGDGQPTERRHLHRAAPDDICRIFLTSGATGEEKGIAVTNRMMALRIDRQKLFFGPQAPFCDRTCLDLSLNTSLGFQVLLAALWRGGALVIAGDTKKTLEVLPIYQVQNMVGSTQSLLNFVEAIRQLPGYRSELRAIFAVDVISMDLSEQVRSHLCSNLTVGYVSMDATMVASMPAQFASGIAGAVGYVLPGVLVETVDDADRVLPSGKEANLRIRSEYGAGEYLADTEASQRMFRDGWFYPGLIGYLTKDKMLVISGQRRFLTWSSGSQIFGESKKASDKL